MKLIPLDTLVAEIDRRISILQKHPMENHKTIYHLDSLKQSINSLEVKEVDLEKEIKEVQRNYKTIDEYEGYPAHIYSSDIELIARHFFELGVNASNPLTWEDVRDIMELYDKVTSMDYCNDIYEEVLKRFKALKEE